MSSRPQQTEEPPVLTDDEPLALAWNKSVSSIATLGRIELEPEANERHRIYALALMSLLRQNWNGNKRKDRSIFQLNSRHVVPLERRGEVDVREFCFRDIH